MSETIPAPLGPVSKRKQKRINNRRVNTAAAEADAILRAHIKDAATELGVSTDEVFQRFALISPVGKQRTPMWWNGLVIEKSAEWKDEYDGPGRKQLSWVTHRIREEGLTSQLTKEEKARYAELAAETRSKNKDAKTASLTRKQAIESAEEQLTQVHNQLETLHARLGVEYLLVTTRGALEDEMAPMYVCSEKADTFLQGHMNIPMKGLLTHLDFYVIGMESAGTKKILGKKQELRVSVRTRLKTSLIDALKKMGADTSNICCVEYANYDKIVYNCRVVLVGYPLTSSGRQMVRPSDFPGGIKGLAHAEQQLATGVWRFEELSRAIYDEWKVKYEKAEANNATAPCPPYNPVPGSEFQGGPKPVQNTEDPGPSRKRKACKTRPATRAKVSKKAKSRKIIIDSDSGSESGPEPQSDRSDSGDEMTGSEGDD